MVRPRGRSRRILALGHVEPGGIGAEAPFRTLARVAALASARHWAAIARSGGLGHVAVSWGKWLAPHEAGAEGSRSVTPKEA